MSSCRSRLLGCSQDSGVLVAQLGVLLHVLDEGDQSILVELAVVEVDLVLQHFVG